MKLLLLLTAFFAAFALAVPIEEGDESMSPNEANILVKRYSCCSGGLAVNCGSCSVNGSGLVCCGNCCKKYAPGNGQCVPGKARVVPNPTC